MDHNTLQIVTPVATFVVGLFVLWLPIPLFNFLARKFETYARQKGSIQGSDTQGMV